MKLQQANTCRGSSDQPVELFFSFIVHKHGMEWEVSYRLHLSAEFLAV
jgi:hypothetical protein